MRCSVSATMLILTHALFRICKHADTRTCLVPYLLPCWYYHIWSLLNISRFHENLKNSSTTPWHRPRQFSQHLARLMDCVAFVFDRTSLNKLCINCGFISSVLCVLEVETLVEFVEAAVCLMQCWPSGTSGVHAWQIQSSKHSATCIYYSHKLCIAPALHSVFYFTIVWINSNQLNMVHPVVLCQYIIIQVRQ